MADSLSTHRLLTSAATRVTRVARAYFGAEAGARERGSQMRATPSREAVARRTPLVLKESTLGGEVGPLSSSRRVPSSRFQRRMARSADAVARMGRVGC